MFQAQLPKGGKLAILLLKLGRLLVPRQRLRRGGEVMHDAGHGGGYGGGQGGRGVGQLVVRLHVGRHGGRSGAWRGHIWRGGSGGGEQVAGRVVCEGAVLQRDNWTTLFHLLVLYSHEPARLGEGDLGNGGGQARQGSGDGGVDVEGTFHLADWTAENVFIHQSVSISATWQKGFGLDNVGDLQGENCAVQVKRLQMSALFCSHWYGLPR